MPYRRPKRSLMLILAHIRNKTGKFWINGQYYMRWYKDLYVSENITGSLKYIQFMVDHGLQVRPLYLIVLSEISDGQLEIIPVATLKIPIFRHKSYDIIGVAKGYYHARSLVERIYGDVYSQTGDCQVKAYFRQKFEKEERA